MLKVGKYLAATATAVAFCSLISIKPAGAVVFLFTGTCDAGCASYGGVGTKVAAELVLDDMVPPRPTGTPALETGSTTGNVYLGQVVSFSMTFDKAPLGSVDYTFDFTNLFKDSSGLVPGDAGYNAASAAELVGTLRDSPDAPGTVAFATLDITDSDGNLFSYRNAEGLSDISWTLVIPPDNIFLSTGSGGPPFAFNKLETIPEPGSLATYLLGTIGLLAFARRRQRRVS